MQELIDRLRGALAEAGLQRAVLSHPETLAHLCLFDPSVEEWPVANPFVASPALLVLAPDAATLLVASFHAGHAARSPVPVVEYRSYDFERPPDPAGELTRALGAAHRRRRRDRRRGLVAADCRRGRPAGTGRRARARRRARRHGAPHQAARSSSRRSGGPRGSPTSSRARSRSSRTRASARSRSRRTRRPRWPARQGGACRPSSRSRRARRPRRAAGRPRIASSSRAISCSATPRRGSTGTGRTRANAVCRRRARRGEQRRIFDRVRRALELAIALCRPGVVACDVDTAVRAELADLGPTLSAPHRPRRRRLVVGAAAHHALRAHRARGGHGARRRARVLRAGIRRHPPRAHVRRARGRQRDPHEIRAHAMKVALRRADRRQRPLQPPRGQLDRGARRRHRHPRARDDRRRARRLGRGDERLGCRIGRGRDPRDGAARDRARPLEPRCDARRCVRLRALEVRRGHRQLRLGGHRHGARGHLRQGRRPAAVAPPRRRAAQRRDVLLLPRARRRRRAARAGRRPASRPATTSSTSRSGSTTARTSTWSPRCATPSAPGPRLRIDANASWSVPQALRMLERLAEHDIDFVEQPVRETPARPARRAAGALADRRVRERGPVVGGRRVRAHPRARGRRVLLLAVLGRLADRVLAARARRGARGAAGLQAHARRARHHRGRLPARAADAAERGRRAPADRADDGARRARRGDSDRARPALGTDRRRQGSASRSMPTRSRRPRGATAAKASTCPGRAFRSDGRSGHERTTRGRRRAGRRGRLRHGTGGRRRDGERGRAGRRAPTSTWSAREVVADELRRPRGRRRRLRHGERRARGRDDGGALRAPRRRLSLRCRRAVREHAGPAPHRARRGRLGAHDRPRA